MMAGLRAAFTLVDKLTADLVIAKWMPLQYRYMSASWRQLSTRSCHPALLSSTSYLSQPRNSSCHVHHTQCRYLKKQAGEHQKFKSRHSKDGVSTDFELIYQTSMRKTYLFFLVSGAAVLAFGVTASSLMFRMLHIKFDTDALKTIAFTNIQVPELYYNICLGIVGIFGVPLWFVLRMMNVSVIRIYHKKGTDMYAAVVKKNLFMRRTMEFTMADVAPTETMGRFGTNGNIQIKGRRCHVFPADFANITYFNTMLGYTEEEMNDKVRADRRFQSKQSQTRQLRDTVHKQTSGENKSEHKPGGESEKRRIQH